MYSHEERKKAVALYIKFGKKASATIRELRYQDRKSFMSWYLEFIESGKLHKLRYTEKQRKFAVAYYKDHGRYLTFTVVSHGGINH